MPTRRKIAMELYPDRSVRNAVRQLHADILRCKELHQKLLARNPDFDGMRNLTYREQRLMWEYLGEP